MIAFRVFRLFSQQGDQKALYLARLPNPLLHFQWYPGRSSIARVEQHILIVRVPRAGGRPGCPASVSANTTLSSQDTGFLDSRTIHWVKKRVEVALGQGVLYTLLRLLLRGCWTMRRPDDNAEDARIADNLRRTIELTEFGLALRQSVVQQDTLIGNAMAQVMREIRRAKEQAWQQSPS